MLPRDDTEPSALMAAKAPPEICSRRTSCFDFSVGMTFFSGLGFRVLVNGSLTPSPLRYERLHPGTGMEYVESVQGCGCCS